MNAMERMLSDELTRLIDRLAGSIPQGGLERIRGVTPTLATRLVDLEARLAAAQTSMVENYARWRQTLDDLENVWALAAWRSVSEDPVDSGRRLAA
jgi:uncharacterized protein involved in exopolysaccharide biosynthesis